MIVVLSPGASDVEVKHIVDRVEESGHEAHVSVGTERTIIGVIGPDLPELQDMFVHLYARSCRDCIR